MPGHAACCMEVSLYPVEDHPMKSLIALLLVAASAVALVACNTVAGAGQDLSAGGHAITNGAEQAK